MIMKKIDEHIYEFFNLEYEDSNLEITDLNLDHKPKNWFMESLKYADFDYIVENPDLFDDEIEYVELVEVIPLTEHKTMSKKDELISSLRYLKSKPNKTKQDRESIYTLEMVLKNMK